jgi:hypothetical protein
MAAQCYRDERIEDALGYSEAGQLLIDSRQYEEVRAEYEALLGALYVTKGEPEWLVELCRNMIGRSSGPQNSMRALEVMALKVAGADDEAMAASEGPLADATAAKNPAIVAWILLAYGFAYSDANPVAAYEALRRGLRIAQESGNRQFASIIAVNLSRPAATQGDPVDAFVFLTLAIRNYHDAGNLSLMPMPLAVLAAFFDRLGRHEPAATISGFGATPSTRTAFPEINATITHLREVLGDPAYESLARKGQTMTTAAIATYAYNQIDQARAELDAVSK